VDNITQAAYITVLQPVDAEHSLSTYLIEQSGRPDGYRPSGVFIRVEESPADTSVSGARQVELSIRIEGCCFNEFNTPVWVNEKLPKGSLTLLWEASKMALQLGMIAGNDARILALMLERRDETVVLKAKGV